MDRVTLTPVDGRDLTYGDFPVGSCFYLNGNVWLKGLATGPNGNHWAVQIMGNNVGFMAETAASETVTPCELVGDLTVEVG